MFIDKTLVGEADIEEDPLPKEGIVRYLKELTKGLCLCS